MTGINSNNQQGFTLIEAVVAITIFLFVIGAVISIFVSVITSERDILSEQQLLNQMSFAQETMSKAMRVAKVDTTNSCITDQTDAIYELTRPNACEISGQSTGKYFGIKFINSSDTTEDESGTCTEFILAQDPTTHNGILEELKGSGGTLPDDSECSPVDAVPLTSPDFNITGIDFALDGQDTTIASGLPNFLGNDGTSQPRVTMVFHVIIQENGKPVTQNIQTTISQRNLNVTY